MCGGANAVKRTLPLAPFRWAREVASDGAPVSPLSCSDWTPLDLALRRAALPLAFCEVEKGSLVLRSGKGSESAMLGSVDPIRTGQGGRVGVS